MKHANEPPPRPSRVVDEIIPIWLDTLVLQLLEKKPEHRPRNAEMVGQALDEVLDKVNKGRSAAVDAVKARAGDRRYQTGLPDETDRAAARTLRSGGKKKPRKKADKRGLLLALKAAGLLALLLVVGVGIWAAARPPSPDELYRRAEFLMQKPATYPEALARIDGKDGPVREFLRRYPDAPQAAQVAEWRDQAETHDLLARLQYNAKKPKIGKPYPNTKMDKNYEANAFLAMRFEEFGDIWYSAYYWRAAQMIAHGDAEQAVAEKLAERRFDDRKKKWLERGEKDEKAYIRTFLTDKLTEAEKARDSQRRKDLEEIATSVTDLYGEEKIRKEMDTGEFVDRANKLLGKKADTDKK